MIELILSILGIVVTTSLLLTLWKVEGLVKSAGLKFTVQERHKYNWIKGVCWLIAVILAILLALQHAITPAHAAGRPPVDCATHGYYNKKTNKTTVRVSTNRPTSKPKFDYRLMRYNQAGDIEGVWVKNRGMKIVVNGEFFGGYAYQGVDQCSPYGVGVG